MYNMPILRKKFNVTMSGLVKIQHEEENSVAIFLAPSCNIIFCKQLYLAKNFRTLIIIFFSSCKNFLKFYIIKS